jgi:hypothetical protein
MTARADLDLTNLANLVRRYPGISAALSSSSNSPSIPLVQKPPNAMSGQALCSVVIATSTFTPEAKKSLRSRRIT